MKQGPYKILIVEDDQAIADSLGSYLKTKDYQVQWAANGLAGVEKVQQTQFDTVIADIMMPEMNGISFLEKCKEDFPDLAVIMITGYADIKVAIEAMKKGAADFITKPFRFDLVEGTIRKLIERKMNGSINSEDQGVQHLNIRLEKKIHELSVLYSISEAMEAVDDADSLFDSLVELAATITNASSAAFYLNDGFDRRFFLKSSYCKNMPTPRSKRAVFAPKVLTMISESSSPLVFFDPQGLDIYQPFDSQVERVQSLILAPLYVKTERFGVLAVEEKVSELQFDNTDINFISLLLKKASIALENNALYETIYNNLVNTLRTLVTTLEAKDQYTQRHSDRVTKIAIQIAKMIGCTDEEIEIISFAGMLHDIGKIGISDAILQKQGKLTDDEYETIKMHPNIGSQILEPLCMLPREQAIIRHHHERWDGNGYPEGLAGKDIPFLARIVSLADAYDAMTSNRVYRKALSHDVALDEINRNAWYQFDGNIVRAFVAICERTGEGLVLAPN